LHFPPLGVKLAWEPAPRTTVENRSEQNVLQ
jgi:hypothetical protein